MRAGATKAELRLWSVLRAERMSGFKFRRQHPRGNYIADFVCLQAKLIIEVDGTTHGEDRERLDNERTEYLTKLGFRVIRFWNSEVFDALEGVAQSIAQALGVVEPLEVHTFPDPLPSPLP